MDNVYTFLEYHFKFEFKDYSGAFHRVPIIIQVIEAPDSDRYAYRQALGRFATHLQFMKSFYAPETLTIKVTKEVKEVK